MSSWRCRFSLERSSTSAFPDRCSKHHHPRVRDRCRCSFDFAPAYCIRCSTQAYPFFAYTSALEVLTTRSRLDRPLCHPAPLIFLHRSNTFDPFLTFATPVTASVLLSRSVLSFAAPDSGVGPCKEVRLVINGSQGDFGRPEELGGVVLKVWAQERGRILCTTRNKLRVRVPRASKRHLRPSQGIETIAEAHLAFGINPSSQVTKYLTRGIADHTRGALKTGPECHCRRGDCFGRTRGRVLALLRNHCVFSARKRSSHTLKGC